MLEAQKNHPNLIVSDDDIAESTDIALGFFNKLNSELITIFAYVVSRIQFDDLEYQLPIEQSLGQIAREIVLRNDQSGRAPNPALPQFA